jgi:hypothetical protein
MVFVRTACFNLLVLLSIGILFCLGIRTSDAGECNVTGPYYQLASDTVEWQLRIVSGQSCVQRIRFHAVENITTIDLISSPQFGQVTVLDHVAFTYMAKPDFQGQDSFSLQVSGAIKKVNGTSTIRIVVSIIGR